MSKEKSTKMSKLPWIPKTTAELIAPETTALVMWDMQNGLAGRASNRESLIVAAQTLVAAADRHGILVIWSRHILPTPDLMVGPWLQFLMRKQGVDSAEEVRPFMQDGSDESKFLPGLQPSKHHVVLEKSMPSLFVDTPLDLRLKARGIRTIVLAGVATDIGIDFTSRHATAKGYFSMVAEDACGAYSAENHERSIAFLRTWSSVATAQQICDIWDGEKAQAQPK